MLIHTIINSTVPLSFTELFNIFLLHWHYRAFPSYTLFSLETKASAAAVELSGKAFINPL